MVRRVRCLLPGILVRRQADTRRRHVHTRKTAHCTLLCFFLVISRSGASWVVLMVLLVDNRPQLAHLNASAFGNTECKMLSEIPYEISVHLLIFSSEPIHVHRFMVTNSSRGGISVLFRNLRPVVSTYTWVTCDTLNFWG